VTLDVFAFNESNESAEKVILITSFGKKTMSVCEIYHQSLVAVLKLLISSSSMVESNLIMA
jgi:hypothetical protein